MAACHATAPLPVHFATELFHHAVIQKDQNSARATVGNLNNLLRTAPLSSSVVANTLLRQLDEHQSSAIATIPILAHLVLPMMVEAPALASTLFPGLLRRLAVAPTMLTSKKDAESLAGWAMQVWRWLDEAVLASGSVVASFGAGVKTALQSLPEHVHLTDRSGLWLRSLLCAWLSVDAAAPVTLADWICSTINEAPHATSAVQSSDDISAQVVPLLATLVFTVNGAAMDDRGVHACAVKLRALALGASSASATPAESRKAMLTACDLLDAVATAMACGDDIVKQSHIALLLCRPDRDHDASLSLLSAVLGLQAVPPRCSKPAHRSPACPACQLRAKLRPSHFIGLESICARSAISISASSGDSSRRPGKRSRTHADSPLPSTSLSSTASASVALPVYLPPDAMHLILSLLVDQPANLVKVASVNKHWREAALSKSLWQPLFAQRWSLHRYEPPGTSERSCAKPLPAGQLRCTCDPGGGHGSTPPSSSSCIPSSTSLRHPIDRHDYYSMFASRIRAEAVAKRVTQETMCKQLQSLRRKGSPGTGALLARTGSNSGKGPRGSTTASSKEVQVAAIAAPPWAARPCDVCSCSQVLASLQAAKQHLHLHHTMPFDVAKPAAQRIRTSLKQSANSKSAKPHRGAGRAKSSAVHVDLI